MPASISRTPSVAQVNVAKIVLMACWRARSSFVDGNLGGRPLNLFRKLRDLGAGPVQEIGQDRTYLPGIAFRRALPPALQFGRGAARFDAGGGVGVGPLQPCIQIGRPEHVSRFQVADADHRGQRCRHRGESVRPAGDDVGGAGQHPYPGAHLDRVEPAGAPTPVGQRERAVDEVGPQRTEVLRRQMTVARRPADGCVESVGVASQLLPVGELGCWRPRRTPSLCRRTRCPAPSRPTLRRPNP